jgi:energy-coupling factor transport system permease protein
VFAPVLPPRVARVLHPIAWWVWAISLAVAASRTTNPLLLVLILGVVGFVVTARRTEAPWARGFKYYLALALVVVAIRVVLRTIFASGTGPRDHILFSFPQVPLPSWISGVTIGGAISLQATLAAATDGLRLGVLLCCIGAANALANPKRALRILPGALYELGVAVVVAISVAPQLIESVQRVRRARQLRGGRLRGMRSLRSIAIPVLEDALERSLQLAAAMDSRGYGRTGTATPRTRRITAVCMLAGMIGLCVGATGLLDASAPEALGLPMLFIGSALCCAGLAIGGRRVKRTRYRPDPWRSAEWVVAGCGVITAAILVSGIGAGVTDLNPSYFPLHWPTLPLVPVVGILIAAVAAVAAPPPPPSRSARRADISARADQHDQRVAA